MYNSRDYFLIDLSNFSNLVRNRKLGEQAIMEPQDQNLSNLQFSSNSVCIKQDLINCSIPKADKLCPIDQIQSTTCLKTEKKVIGTQPHSFTSILTYSLWLLSYYKAQLSSYSRKYMIARTENIYHLLRKSWETPLFQLYLLHLQQRYIFC